MTRWMVAATVCATLGTPSPSHGQVSLRTLTVVVLDQTDAAIAKARVAIQDGPLAAAPTREATTDGRGEAVFAALGADPLFVRIESPGFATEVVGPLVLRGPSTVYRVRLHIAGYVEEVTVRRDPRDAQTDRRGDAFVTVLTPAQIAELSDDPQTMQRQLEQLAGPGAVFRLDGFRGGRFPSKQEIARIRIVWNVSSAEFHDGGTPLIDVTTKPGGDRYYASLGGAIQLADLAARPAFAATPTTPSSQVVSVGAGGPIVQNRVSFLLFGQGTHRFDPAPVVAAGSSSAPEVPSPDGREWVLAGRVGFVLGGGWSLRSALEHRANDVRNLGVGALDLPDRAYARHDGLSSVAVSSSGPLGHGVFLETRARVELGHSTVDPVSQAPAIVVSGALRRGGAQVEGGRQVGIVEVGQDVDIPWRQHAIRAGFQVEREDVTSDEWSNRTGTFTFASLDAWADGTPTLFTQRLGNPSIHVGATQVGVYVQDDVRLRRGLSLSVGVRQEGQSHAGAAWNLAPRLGVAWSPFPDGRTTFMGTFGRYYSWVALSTLETVTLLDGSHQREVMVQEPGYPDPYGHGQRQVVPVNRYEMAPHLSLPQQWQASLSLQRDLAAGLTLRAAYEQRWGESLLRGRNVNAPTADGGRPDPSAANVIQVESTARSRATVLRLSVNGRIPHTTITLVSNYAYGHAFDDADGPFALPADATHPEAEWAPSSIDVRHRLVLGAFATWRSRLFVSTTVMATSALPYTLTTGGDENGDGIFNDRPAGVARNTLRQASQWYVQTRVSWSVPLHRSPQPTGTVASVAGIAAASSRGPKGVVYVDVQNLLNNQSPFGFIGVRSSPLFGRPTSAQAPRRIVCGFTVEF